MRARGGRARRQAWNWGVDELLEGSRMTEQEGYMCEQEGKDMQAMPPGRPDWHVR